MAKDHYDVSSTTVKVYFHSLESVYEAECVAQPNDTCADIFMVASKSIPSISVTENDSLAALYMLSNGLMVLPSSRIFAYADIICKELRLIIFLQPHDGAYDDSDSDFDVNLEDDIGLAQDISPGAGDSGVNLKSGDTDSSDSEFDVSLESDDDIFNSDELPTFKASDTAPRMSKVVDEDSSDEISDSDFELALDEESDVLALDEDEDDEDASEDYEDYEEDEDAIEAGADDEDGEKRSENFLEEKKEESISTSKPAAPRDTRSKGKKSLSKERVLVRYYDRMTQHKMFPLMVLITNKTVIRKAKENVRQAVSQPTEMDQSKALEVIPTIPGCTCFPRRAVISLDGPQKEARFWVLVHTLGHLSDAHVDCFQDGSSVMRVPLNIECVSSRSVVTLGILSLGMPVLSAVLKANHLDLESQVSDGFTLYVSLLNTVLGKIPSDILLLTFLLAAFCMFLWTRPRKKEVFWDVETIGERALMNLAISSFNAGRNDDGTRYLNQLIEDFPSYIPGLRLAGDLAFRAKNYAWARRQYKRAIECGDSRSQTRTRLRECQKMLGD
jgi:hypothetical protein